MKVLELLTELEELVEKGNTLPFSSKALVSPEEIMEIIDEIRGELPKELSEAREIVKEKKKILVQAESDAERIRGEAEKKLKEMIDTNEITRTATAQAEQIMQNAQNVAKEIRIGTQHYSDKILYNLQVQLKELNDKIEANRKELKG
ncbi:MAG: hypothetical protein Q4C55_00710 [Eubacterium sp.]|nr:hypothetical protein [Eubacterium sp.]